jgi:outer membrane protein assembly factor BamE (lipoprotein component of BamABCDE complex)
MRFRLRSLLLATACIAVLIALVSIWARSLDGVLGNLFALVGPDDTVWADSYSGSSFRAIRPGMTRNEVYALLGPPLEVRQSNQMFDFDTARQNPGEIVECWTRTPEDSSYHVRQIVFKEDRVVDKNSEFYLD